MSKFRVPGIVIFTVALIGSLIFLVATSDGTATVQDDTPPRDALKSVTSGCDEFGNRVYIRGDSPKHALFVVPADVTCP